MMRYPIIMTPSFNGTWIVSCPDFPEIVAEAAEAEAIGADAIMAAVAGRMSVGKDVPLPSNWPGSATTFHPLDCDAIKHC